MRLKKNFAYTALLVCVLMLLSACTTAGPVEPSKSAEPQATPLATVQPTPQLSAEPSAEPTIEPTPQPVVISDDIKAMLPVMDSVIRAIKENGSAYAPADDTFIWSTLYLASVNFGDTLQVAEMKDDQFSVSAQAVQEIAAACFTGLAELPEIPESLAGAVSYDKKEKAYLFTLSDIGDSSTDIVNVEPQGDAFKVTVEFSSWDETEDYEFVLVKNTYADEPMFAYSVSSANKTE